MNAPQQTVPLQHTLTWCIKVALGYLLRTMWQLEVALPNLGSSMMRLRKDTVQLEVCQRCV